MPLTAKTTMTGAIDDTGDDNGAILTSAANSAVAERTYFRLPRQQQLQSHRPCRLLEQLKCLAVWSLYDRQFCRTICAHLAELVMLRTKLAGPSCCMPYKQSSCNNILAAQSCGTGTRAVRGTEKLHNCWLSSANHCEHS